MAKPTERALLRKPQAVVYLAWEQAKGQFDLAKAPDDHDFEWFETDEGRSEYFDHIAAWNAKDFAENGDLIFLTAEVTDTATKPMTLGRVSTHPALPEEAKGPVTDQVIKDLHAKQREVTADVSLLFAAAAAKKAPVKGAKIKGKAGNPAAAAAIEKADGARKGVRRAVAKPKGAAKKAAAVKPPEAKRAALRERIDAKKADEMAALDAAAASVNA